MAINPKLIQVAAKVLMSEKTRKLILYAVFISLGLIMIIAVTFSGLISGLLDIAQTTDLKNHWQYMRECLSDVLSGMEGEIDNEVKAEVYDFMPDFSVNLSKAAINSGFDGNSLILYDSEEMDIAEREMKQYADELRRIADANELDEYLIAYEDADISFSDISSMKFSGDSGIDGINEYPDGIKAFLYNRAMEQMPRYEYLFEETTTEDGRPCTMQTLNVISPNGGVQTVEYICIGGGSIYLPHFLAMYNVRQTREFLLAVESHEAEDIDKQIEKAVGDIPETAEDAEKYIQGAWEGITDGKGAIKLNVFEVSNLTSLLENVVTDGNMAVTTERTDNKLTITLESPAEEMWVDIFEIDDEITDYVEEAQKVIELALEDAEIPEEEWTLSLDAAVQAALFVYFEGFFELPVDSSDLARGANGILSQCGDISDIHSYKYGSKEYGVPEKGITLELADGETPVYANLLNCGNCIVDAVIYDVWDMENGGHYIETARESRVFNYSAVTIAYIIDTNIFEEEYGFPFPSIDGVTGGGTITLFLEFTCLDSVNVSELDIGYSIYDIFGSGDILVGYSHSGEYSGERDMGSWRHDLDRDEYIPHVGIKTYFMSGEVYVDPPNGVHTYGGPSAKNIGVPSNPRLWFKGFRTDMSDELMATLIAAKP